MIRSSGWAHRPPLPLRRTFAVGVTVTAMLVAGCSSGDDAGSGPAPTSVTGSWDSVVAAAKQEGKVVIYSSIEPGELDSLKAGFNAKYPDIKVESIRTGSADAQARLDQERTSRSDGADVAIITEKSWYAARSSAGELLELDGPDASDWRDLKDSFYRDHAAIRTNPWVLGWNTKIYPKGLHSYQDVLAADLKGKLGTLGLSSTAVISNYDNLEQKYGESYLRGFAAQQPHLYVSVVPMAQALGAGEVGATVFSTAITIEAAKKQGAPVDYALPSDLAFGVDSYVGALAWSKRPNAARVFADYVLSVDGQNALFKGPANGVSPLGVQKVPQSIAAPNIIKTDQSRYTKDFVNTFTAHWNSIFVNK